MRRSLRVGLVVVVLATLWGYCIVACFDLVPGESEGRFGQWAIVFLTGTVVLSVFLLCPQAMGYATHQAFTILRRTRCGVAASSFAILAFLTCFLWARSYWRIDGIDVPVRGTRHLTMTSLGGILTIGWRTDSVRSGNEPIQWASMESEPYLSDAWWARNELVHADRKAGCYTIFYPYRSFDMETRTVSLGGRTLGGISISFPHWFPMALCTISPTVGVAKAYRRYRRRRRGRCTECDYNLKGNISGICPECGTAIPPNRAESGSESPA